MNNIILLLSLLIPLAAASMRENEKPAKPEKYVCCNSDQEPVKCPNECNVRTCDNLQNPPNPATCSKKCYKDKCQCKPPYYANRCNECVTADNCDKECNKLPENCCAPNERLFACFKPDKARVCPNVNGGDHEPACVPDSPFGTQLYDVDYTEAGKPADQCILNICDCISGYLRNKCGVCVEKKYCTKPCRKQPCEKCSDPNEIRYKRWRECDARTCKNRKSKMECDRSYDKTYRNQCDCKPYYYRDDCGRCVPMAKCPKDKQDVCKCANPCDKDKTLACINTCSMKTCASAEDTSRKCDKKCHLACNCKGSTYLDQNGNCVKKSQCTPADVTATETMVDPRDVESGSPTQDDPIPANDPVITANVVAFGEEMESAPVADEPPAADADTNTESSNGTDDPADE